MTMKQKCALLYCKCDDCKKSIDHTPFLQTAKDNMKLLNKIKKSGGVTGAGGDGYLLP
jgi:hypothetical protein